MIEFWLCMSLSCTLCALLSLKKKQKYRIDTLWAWTRFKKPTTGSNLTILLSAMEPNDFEEIKGPTSWLDHEECGQLKMEAGFFQNLPLCGLGYVLAGLHAAGRQVPLAGAGALGFLHHQDIALVIYQHSCHDVGDILLDHGFELVGGGGLHALKFRIRPFETFWDGFLTLWDFNGEDIDHLLKHT